MYPKIAAGVGDTRLATPQRLTVQTPAPARGTRVRLSCDPQGGPDCTTSHSRPCVPEKPALGGRDWEDLKKWWNPDLGEVI